MTPRIYLTKHYGLLASIALLTLMIACSGDDTAPADHGVQRDTTHDQRVTDAKVDQRRDSGTDSTPLPDGPAQDVAADATQPDKGTPTPDKGTPTPDKGTPTPDKGTPDQATPTPDQATPTPDITVTPDQSTAWYTGTFPAASSFPGSGFKSATLGINGSNRLTWLYKPTNLKAKPALLVAYHGTSGLAQDTIWDAEADILADAEGLLVIAPQARTMTVGDWDAHIPGDIYFETYPNVTPATNQDLEHLQAIITEAIRVYNVDPKRVYLTGYSNGAFFVTLAATAMPTWIAGAAEAGGGLVRCADVDTCYFAAATPSTLTCAAMTTQPDWCACSGAAKPGPIPNVTGQYKPAIYMFHRNQDQAVSVYYACQMQSELTAAGYPVKFDLITGSAHAYPAGFATTTYAWLKQYTLP